MKKISTLVVSIIVLTSFLFINRVHAQTGPIAKLQLWTDSTNTLIDFDTSFFATNQWPYGPPQSDPNGFNFGNVGDEPLVFTVSTSNPDFICDYGTYTAPGDHNEFYMVFRPSKTGLSTGVITITTNDPNQEEITFNVKGYGMEPPVDTRAEQFDLVVGTSVTKQMVVRNTTPNRGKFRIESQSPDYPIKLIISKDGDVLEEYEDFILEPGDSAAIDLLFECLDVTEPFQDGPYKPLFIRYEPFHDDGGGLTLNVYKNFFVNGIAPVVGLSVSEDTIHHEARVSTISSTSFAIQNLGDQELNYSIEMDSLLNENGSNTGLYYTGFEDFSLGNIDNQKGWLINSGNAGDFTIESSNPSEGSKHISYYADGSNTRSVLYSPKIQLGDDDITVVRMKLDVDLGVTWGIDLISGSGTEPSTATTFGVSPEGNLFAYVRDGGNAILQMIPGTLPDTGYFDFRIKVKASTQEFIIYVNNKAIFTGQARTGKFRSVDFYTYNEQSGPRLVIDEFSIYSEPNENPWLAIEPQSGNISSGASANVNVLFDATDIVPGTYSKILKISTDNILIPILSIPVTLVVIPNRPPILSPVANKSVRAQDVLNLQFTATDPDDSVVSVSITNLPSFVTLTHSGNGSAQYSVKPLIGDAGNHEIIVTATDPLGGLATETFNLEVTPFYGVQNFSLIYFKTGALVRNFEDTIILDIADPEIEKYTIRANTNPETVGSVKFALDGTAANTDNSRQYAINNWLLPVLSGGNHSITAQAFTKTNGGGEAGHMKSGIIKMINSASITDFDVVNGNGVKLLDLVDGGIININQPGFNMINLVANTSVNSVRSVKFILNGPTARIDNVAPFALKGNANGGDTSWPPKPGFYTLTATPYMKSYAWGPQGTPLTIHFQVINGIGSTSSAGRIANSMNDNQQSETFDSENILSIYPVPVVDELNIELHESIKGNVALNIMNAQGQSVHAKADNADEFRKYSISTVQLGISQGIYFVIVNHENGTRIVKKFIKE